MATKYQTSFQYQREEKRMDFFKVVFAGVLIIGACIAAYIYAVPSEKRMGWFNEGMEQATMYYEDGVAYVAEFLPDASDLTGKNAMNEASMIHQQMESAPLKNDAEKIKIIRSNKVQTEQ